MSGVKQQRSTPQKGRQEDGTTWQAPPHEIGLCPPPSHGFVSGTSRCSCRASSRAQPCACNVCSSTHQSPDIHRRETLCLSLHSPHVQHSYWVLLYLLFTLYRLQYPIHFYTHLHPSGMVPTICRCNITHHILSHPSRPKAKNLAHYTPWTHHTQLPTLHTLHPTLWRPCQHCTLHTTHCTYPTNMHPGSSTETTTQ